MKLFFIISIFSLIAICRSADESSDELKLLTKLSPVNSAQNVYPANTRNQGDLVESASDRTFHITKGGYPGSIGGYPGGYLGRYPGGYPYDTGIIGSVYPGTSYRGSNLIPGYGGYLGPGGLIGGGYGYYGNYPGYGGYGGYGGYRGYGGYGDYGRGYYPGSYGGYGGYGVGGYDNLGYGRDYGRYDGYDNYGYGNTYGTYGSTYAARSPYSPYSYRSDSYGTSLSNPSGYRGYS
ncbi:PREDICTED: prisilkin-39-like isoform X1 [Acromyrmex echinatior]|uniref:prisilkin-39-like isoform X1 n=1 Tax=Acromyrmex echinatior TaxID=103372 RepID=UPI000581082F|nr:PREDICTED: prisilkin-39-like isoform X1 [Acromyrmex echinatior]